MKLLDGTHYAAKPSALEQKTVRLWIESGATYPGTYASLGCGDYGIGLPGQSLRQRCGECHGKEVQDRRGPRYVFEFRRVKYGDQTEPFCNLSRPEKSYLLLAPMSKQAGGLGLCGKPVLAGTDDPLYQSALKAIRDAGRRLEEGRRFDLPGFRPNQHYVREMQRFGFLPKDLRPETPIDVYVVDRAYWNSFRWQPWASGGSSADEL